MGTAAGSIVVGYDASPDSDRALDWAFRVATASSRHLRVMVVGHDRNLTSSRVPGWDQRKVLDRVCEQAEARMVELGVSEPDLEVGQGSAAGQLIESGADASMLVLGSRGQGRVKGLVVGSVSQHVARYATCPVVVVRAPKHPAGRVVVGVDGSGGSRTALEFACEQADALALSVTVLHCFRPSQHAADSPDQPTGIPLAAAVLTEDTATADRILEKSVSRLEESYPGVTLHTEAVAAPATKSLVRASADADLVVVGSRGRGAFEGLLLGSVSQEVLARAHCPVAVAR